MPRDYYEVFGLDPLLSLDAKDLEQRFHSLSRQWHPDRFARRSPAEREEALDISATLNDAYRTLREPIARVQYLLKREGFDVGEQGTKEVPPELLEEVFELNMALEELKAGDEDALPQVEAAGRQFTSMRDAADAELRSKFAEWDAGRNHATLTAIRSILNRRKYITNLIAQTESATRHVSDRV